MNDVDRLAHTIAEAINTAIQTAVQRELSRMALQTADHHRAVFIDAFARTQSGTPNPNKVLVRSTANDLVRNLEGYS